MNSKLAIPTDNIYKFEAIFGLAILLASLLGLIYSLGSYPETLFNAAIELEKITDNEKKVNLESAYAGSMQAGLQFALGVSIIGCVVGVICSRYGFNKWSNLVQPVDDSIRALDKQKLDLEIKILQEELRIKKKKKNDD